MTEQEAIKFVTDEIRGRNPKVTDAQCVDWMAVVRPFDIAKARQIVQAIATDPDEPFLTPKAFTKRVRAAETEKTGPAGKFRYGYAVDEPFQVFVVKQADPRMRVHWSYPTRRIYETGAVQVIDWTWERLHDAMMPALWQYGDGWILEIKEPPIEATAGELLRMRANRLAAQVAEALPKVETPKPPTMPDRAILERIGQPITEEPSPIMADDEFFDQEERAALQSEGRSTT